MAISGGLGGFTELRLAEPAALGYARRMLRAGADLELPTADTAGPVTAASCELANVIGGRALAALANATATADVELLPLRLQRVDGSHADLDMTTARKSDCCITVRSQ